ncbi:MAG: phosphoribosyltransferase [Carboxydocellales bacterium]
MFADRRDAGVKLAIELEKLSVQRPIVIAVPRGGIIVGAEIARSLHAPLDVVISRKIGTPGNPEVAIGAVTPDGEVVFNQQLMKAYKFTPQDLDKEISIAIQELGSRLKRYSMGKRSLDWKDRTVILVDDGIATGFTLAATIEYVRKQQPAGIILAVPVAPAVVAKEMQTKVDQLICLITAEKFYAVGQFYEDFDQTEDAEALRLLQQLGATVGV